VLLFPDQQPAHPALAQALPHAMYPKFFISALALAATATALPGGGSSGGGSPPTTAPPQCCQNVKNSNDVDSLTAGILKTLLGIDISALNVPIGTGCTPIDILGGVSWYVFM
jgi:hypothetical protein